MILNKVKNETTREILIMGEGAESRGRERTGGAREKKELLEGEGGGTANEEGTDK